MSFIGGFTGGFTGGFIGGFILTGPTFRCVFESKSVSSPSLRYLQSEERPRVTAEEEG